MMDSDKRVYYFLIPLFVLMFCMQGRGGEKKKKAPNLFAPLYIGMNWDTALKKCKKVFYLEGFQTREAMFKWSSTSSQLDFSQFCLDALLPSGLKITIVGEAKNNNVMMIFTKDPNFDFNGLRIGLPAIRALEYIKNPYVVIRDGEPITLRGDNNVAVSLCDDYYSFSKFPIPPMIWNSDTVTMIIEGEPGYVMKKLNFDDFFIDEPFMEWLRKKEEGNINCFAPLYIGMARSEVEKLVTLHEEEKVPYYYKSQIKKYRGALEDVEITLFFCSEQSPANVIANKEDKSKQILFAIETRDPRFSLNEQTRVGESIRIYLTDLGDSTWFWETIDDIEYSSVFFKNGLAFLLERIDYSLLNSKEEKVPDVKIVAIQNWPKYVWELRRILGSPPIQ